MVLEIAQFEIKPGQEAAFEAGVAEGAAFFKAARGCRHFRLERTIERPSCYRLFIEWESIDDHMVHFRQSDAMPGWRALISPHFASPPIVEHVAVVVDAF